MVNMYNPEDYYTPINQRKKLSEEEIKRQVEKILNMKKTIQELNKTGYVYRYKNIVFGGGL